MRTNIVIDDDLMKSALRSGNYHSKRKAVEDGLKLLIQLKSQKRLMELGGKLNWVGDLEKMRRD